MHRFWFRYLAPLIEAAAPRHIIEVGAEFGWNTVHILHYCRRTGCKLDVVDPAPHPTLHKVLARFPSEHRYHPLKSLDAIPLLQAADVVLLDGDHNWYTVYHELQLLFARAVENGVAAPVVALHDLAWPYARRDMYYDPEAIPEGDRHPYMCRGILPGQSELADDGLNGTLNNALHEGGPCNGVLTGVEDFIASWPKPITLYRLPFFNGLGIMVPQERETPELQTTIDSFFSATMMAETCAMLELDAMKVRTELAAVKLKLAQREEALSRARGSASI
jgi:hypothetical protein